jgi:DNA modification methylase
MFLTPPTLIETSKLKTHPSNPRFIRKEKLESLKRSISEDPKLLTVRPLLVNPQMEVFAGNQRLRACIALEWEAIPCHVLDWTEEEQRRAMIKDNASSGEWDQDMLANDGWDAEQLQEWGVPIDWEPVQETEGLTDPDDVPEVPEEPTTKPGDLWILGDHRLLCGDSTKAEDVERLMHGATADALVTDPPYGINANKQTLGNGKKKFQRGEDWDSAKPDILPLLGYCETHVIWGGNYFADVLPPTNDWLCWDKKKAPNLPFSEFELAYTNLGKNCRILSHHWSGETKLHPTMKPVAVMEWCVDMTEGTIFDPFLGSGSTLIAAEKTGRKCYGMELDPKYCDVIVKRWEDFTGKKARLENEEDTFEILTQAH